MRAELTAALMIKSLIKGADGRLSLPDKAGLAKEDIDAICKSSPTYQRYTQSMAEHRKQPRYNCAARLSILQSIR